MKVLCLFVRYGLGRYPNAIAELDAWYAKQGLLEQRELWVIDNSLPPGTFPTLLRPGVVLRAGDNRAWEFSGWTSALAEAATAPGIEVIHIVTSAFNTLYTGYLDHFRPEILSLVASNRVCAGHIDSYPEPIELDGHRSDHWIRSCFFFVGQRQIAHLPPFVRFDCATEVFSGENDTSFHFAAPLSSAYQQLIVDWLCGGEIGGYRWHSPVKLGREEIKRFQDKTLAILNEHRFSIGLRERRWILGDFCWLSHTYDPTNAIAIPSGRRQIDFRNTFLEKGVADPSAFL